jgi:hypothetical protein
MPKKRGNKIVETIKYLRPAIEEAKLLGAETERTRIVEAMKKLYRPHYRASSTTSASCYSYSVPEGRPEENCTCGKTGYDYALSLVFSIVNGVNSNEA